MRKKRFSIKTFKWGGQHISELNKDKLYTGIIKLWNSSVFYKQQIPPHTSDMQRSFFSYRSHNRARVVYEMKECLLKKPDNQAYLIHQNIWDKSLKEIRDLFNIYYFWCVKHEIPYSTRNVQSQSLYHYNVQKIIEKHN